MRSRRIRSPSRRERRPSRALQVRPALAFASPRKEESLPWMQAGSPTCRPPGHYGAEWNACMKLATAASCREASVTLAPLRTKVLRPRFANVRDDMRPNGPGTNCRIPTKPDGFRRVLPQPRQSGVAAARGGLASSDRDEMLVAWLIFSWRFLGDFLEMPGSRRPRPGSSVVSGSTTSNRRTRRSRKGGCWGRATGRWPRFSPCRPLIVNSPGAKRKMRLGRPATTAAIDHGSERRARPQ